MRFRYLGSVGGQKVKETNSLRSCIVLDLKYVQATANND